MTRTTLNTLASCLRPIWLALAVVAPGATAYALWMASGL